MCFRYQTFKTNDKRIYCHPVLGKSSGFVSADDSSRAQSFYGFKVLYKGIPRSHSPGSQAKGKSYCGQKPFRHICNYNSDRKDEACKKGIMKKKRKKEEDYSHKNRNCRDDFYEAVEFSPDGSVDARNLFCEYCKFSNLGVLPCSEDDSLSIPTLYQRPGKNHISALKYIRVSAFKRTQLRLRLSCDGRMINFQRICLN